jgi:2-oxoglutarate dehydrogenase E1 component
MDKFSYIGNSDVAAMEELYKQFLTDPNSVDKTWQDFFKGFEFARTNYAEDKNTGSVTNKVPENVGKEFAVIILLTDIEHEGIYSPKQTR